MRIRQPRRSDWGRTTPLGALGAMLLVALISAVFLLEVPARVAELGSGNLDRLVAPTTTAGFGASVKLAGRDLRPPMLLVAMEPQRVRSATRGVRPARGMKFVGQPFVVRNVGTTPFLSSMGIEVTATDGQGQVHRPVGDLVKLRGQKLLHMSRLRPGAERRGVVVFELPRSGSISSVRFTVGIGLVRTAEWTREEPGK